VELIALTCESQPHTLARETISGSIACHACMYMKAHGTESLKRAVSANNTACGSLHEEVLDTVLSHDKKVITVQLACTPRRELSEEASNLGASRHSREEKKKVNCSLQHLC
jgi:stage V sporulation protein SpoVS